MATTTPASPGGFPSTCTPPETEITTTMNAYGIYLAALHQQDLLEQAQDYRRVKLASASHDSVAAWRKLLSDVLASAARQVDPTVQVERVQPLSNGRGADLLPAC